MSTTEENLKEYRKGLSYYIHELGHYCNVHSKEIPDELQRKIWSVVNVHDREYMLKWFGIPHFISKSFVYPYWWRNVGTGLPRTLWKKILYRVIGNGFYKNRENPLYKWKYRKYKI